MSEEKEMVEGGVLVWGNENAPEMDTLRAAIRSFTAAGAEGARPVCGRRCDSAGGDAAGVRRHVGRLESGGVVHPEMHARLSAEVRREEMAAARILRGWPEFVEDFIGGKIKKRKGDRKPHFTDAKQIQLLALEDADLAWHVRAWGRWVLERARQELAARYPMVDGSRRWHTCGRERPRPADNRTNPSAKNLLALQRKGKRTALLPVPTADGRA